MTGTSDTEKLNSWRKNTHSSQAKLVIEDWYKRNFIDNNSKDKNGNLYYSYIYDSPFCVEKNMISATNRYYAVYRARTSFEPSLLCGGTDGSLRNKSDLFTYNDTLNGNGLLDYPVALLTSDEVLLAGMPSNTSDNLTYYLYSALNFWLLSPSAFWQSSSYVASIFNSGRHWDHGTNFNSGLRPVISLSPSVKITKGTGTYDDAYIVALYN